MLFREICYFSVSLGEDTKGDSKVLKPGISAGNMMNNL